MKELHQQLMAAVWCVLAVACAGESGTSGLGEPLQVTGGAFKSGALPGAAADADADASDDALRITTVETNNTVVHPGQSGKRITGRATDNGYAIAVRFEKLGTGYWVRPLGEADSAYPGELSFRLDVELAADIPLGPQRLVFSVIDDHGRASRQQVLTMCVTSRFDRNLSACDPTQKPPAAVISLTWDSDADLDLIVHTPTGEVVDARHPSTLTEPGITDVDRNYQGVLFGAASESCGADATRREDLVWANEVPAGEYQVFVNLFNACGAGATFFNVSATVRVADDDTEYYVSPLGEPVLGQVIAPQANGGRDDGSLITSFEFP